LGHLGTFVAKLASDVGFIDLYGGVGVSQLNVFGFPHGFADPVSHIPGSLVSHADITPELAGGNALLGIAHQRDRREPLGQWKVGVMEKSAGRRTELKPTASALKQTPRAASLVGGLDRPALAVIAHHAANAFRPARFDQMIVCIFFCLKPARQRVKIHHLPRLHAYSHENTHASTG
jgi:hypothetical protein